MWQLTFNRFEILCDGPQAAFASRKVPNKGKEYIPEHDLICGVQTHIQN